MEQDIRLPPLLYQLFETLWVLHGGLAFSHSRILGDKRTSPEPINAESLFNCIDTDDSSDFSFDEVCTEYKCKGESPIHTEEHINEYFAGTDCVTKCQLYNSLIVYAATMKYTINNHVTI